jgi:sugar phosphate permease
VISTLYIAPSVIGAIAMVVNSLHSDKVRERRHGVAIRLVGGEVFLLAAVAASGQSLLLAYAFMCLAGIGLFRPLGPFWAIPSETLPKKTAGSAIGLIDVVGSLGGYS